tara:strand:- start:296 stop:472 length:177 start_codon:yes stop_codon:yes gene_type:complete
MTFEISETVLAKLFLLAGSTAFILLAIGWSINKVKNGATIKWPYGRLDHLGDIGAYEK